MAPKIKEENITTTTTNTPNGIGSYSSNPKVTKLPLRDAPPSLHTVSLWVCFIGIFVSLLPSLENDIDTKATVNVLTQRVFPNYISLFTLGMIRVGMALTIWCISIYTICFDSKGIFVATNYKSPKTKLINTSFSLTGFKTLTMFTHWSWIMLGISFSLNGAIALDTYFGYHHHITKWMVRIGLISFEIAAPISFLVSAVVAHVIWPNCINLSDLQHPRTLVWHNFNIIFSLVEVCLLGGIPIHFSHIAFAPLYGCLYVLFAWNTTKIYTSTTKYGPQFLYHFFDTTVPKESSIALVALLLVLMVAYTIFSNIHSVLDIVDSAIGGSGDGDGSIITHMIAVCLVASLVCRVR